MVVHTVRRRRRSRLLALITSSIVVTALPLAAGAQDANPDDARRQLQEQQAALNGQIDATRAADQDVSAALSSTGGELEHQRLRVADTDRGVASAEAALAAARDAVAAAKANKERAAAQLREAAVDSYVRPPLDGQIDQLLTTEPDKAEVRAALARSALRTTADALDQMRAAQQDLERAEARADAAELDAHKQRVDAEARLVELDLAHQRQEDLVADVETRLDHLLSEAATLQSRDANLAAQITQREAALAAQAAAAAAQAAAATQPHAHPPSDLPQVLAYRSSGNVALATVGGIEVAAEIADQLGRMIAAAAADGITLEGGGWRSPDEQISIRMEVCGTSDYAIWEMPSWECSPPVARPGRSMHDQGLAIDFTADGDLIRSHSHPAFVWLASNAERFGFYNLPSEPWHWSTTGS
jgi:LAS superfamily LD-carboxypeptidase LdcB